MPRWSTAWDFETPDAARPAAVPPADPFAAPGEPPQIQRPVQPAGTTQPAAAQPVTAKSARLPVSTPGPEVCRSGLHCLRGPFGGAAPLVQGLAGVAPLLLIARPDVLPPPPSLPGEPEPAAEPAPVTIPADRPPVLNWYPPVTARVASPALYAPAAPQTSVDILTRCWGHDAAVLVLTRLPPSAALLMLRGAIRGDDGASTAPPAGVRMFYTPAGARSVLRDAPAEIVAPLMQHVECVVMEADDPGEWLLFATPEAMPTVRAAIA